MNQPSTPLPGTPAAIEQNKAAAELMLRRLGNAYEQTVGQVTNASKWLLATLVAINGGGALATINLLPRLGHPAWPASFFAAGLLLTVLSGVAIQHIAEALLAPIATQEVFWRQVEATGQFDPAGHTAAGSDYERMSKIGLVAPALGWLGGVCFLIGLISLAVQAATGDPANNARCRALQTDMLSAVPRKKDGVAIFVALGCRPQGEGSVIVPPTFTRRRGS